MTTANDALKVWLAGFPYETLKAEMAQVQDQINKYGARLVELQEAIRLYERFRAPVPPSNGAHPVAAAAVGKPTLREAVRRILAEDPNREWSSAQLYDEFVDRGWLRDDAQGRNNLHAMLSVMTKHGQIQRVRIGWYQHASELLVRVPEEEA